MGESYYSILVRVLDVEVKRQRISLTMRLDDAPGSGSASDRVPVERPSGIVRDPLTGIHQDPSVLRMANTFIERSATSLHPKRDG